MASPATLTEVGVIPNTTPATVPSCPASPCEAVSRTTGYQVQVGTQGSVVSAPRSGMVVAWTITLGKPNATEIKYLDANEGGVPEAAIAILEPQATVAAEDGPAAKTPKRRRPSRSRP